MRFKTLAFSVFMLLFIYFKNVKCDSCEFSTCGDCISFAFEQCVWCAKDEFNGRRCMSISDINSTWCEPKYRKNPVSKIITIEAKNFSDIKNQTVQLSPQFIKMNLRPGLPVPFDISYKPAKDFPLDVYYLMDVSYTMEKKFEQLKKQADIIHRKLSKYTNNVQLGVGTFIEKRGFPFFDKNYKHTGDTYKNIISLTNNMTVFNETINKVKFGSNYDDPEAGLDALMQAMTCEKEVGWRPTARRIIVLCTDSTYHSAGDGKMVGAIKPHDMKCYLKDNLYTEALTFDYPSVSQINKVAMDGKFKIIFAIAKPKDKDLPSTEYTGLARQISGAKFAILEDDSSVLQMIKEAYEEMTDTVELISKMPPSLEITFDQDCESEPKRNCVRNHTHPIVTIPAKIKLKSCPKESNFNVTVSPVGLDEKLTIDINVDCECDCESAGNVLVVSPTCNNAGVIKCGICYCEKGSYGANCQCNGTSTYGQDMEKCIKNGTTGYCSGQGICVCGKCEKCSKGYSGDFCEFDDTSCPWPGGKLCFGHGNCTRGSCTCSDGWTGDDCQCSLSKSTCYAPSSKVICSGNGKCNCGKCECNNGKDKDDTIYSGVYCDSCEGCAERRCKELEDYAYCNYEHSDNKNFCDQENNDKTKDIIVFFANKTEINSAKWYMAVWCKKELKNGSYINFKYQYDKHNLNLVIQKELEHPPEANPWIAAGTAIGLVVLIGLLTVIIWKILVDIHDKREYNKFADEAKAAGYDVSENPLYERPTAVFNNPGYNCSFNEH